MHGKNGVGAFHKSAWPSNRNLPWESGAEDARAPNADASSADSAASAQRLECAGRAQRRRRFGSPENGFGHFEFGSRSAAQSKAAWRFASRRGPRCWPTWVTVARRSVRSWSASSPRRFRFHAGFMVPLHGRKAEEAFHEPQFPNRNDESRNPKEYRNPNDKTADRTPERRSAFELRILSSFVIRHSLFDTLWETGSWSQCASNPVQGAMVAQSPEASILRRKLSCIAV